MERFSRVRRAADILVDAGVLDEARADEVLLMLVTALSVRGQQGLLVPGLAGRLRRPQPGAAAPDDDDPWRVIRPSSGQVPGSKLMALIVTANRMVAPATLRFPPSAGLTDLAAPSFAELIASDDTGATYKVNFTDGGWAGSTWTGTILFRPPPSPDARVLTVTGPNGPVLRVHLISDEAAGQPAATVAPVPDSPGERLLIRRAEALLAAHVFPDGRAAPAAPAARLTAIAQAMRPFDPSMPAAAPPGPAAVFATSVAGREPHLAEVVTVLEGARILSPLSPVPARIATLSRTIGAADSAAGPGAGEALPARWRELLAYYGRRGRQPPAAGTGSIGVTLPRLDGARFAVAGVHTGSTGTILHVIARGLRPVPLPGPARPGRDTRFSWWVRDEGGAWHLAIAGGWNLAPDDMPLRLALLPPLQPGAPGSTGTLTLEVSGPASRLTADLAVHW